MSENNELNIERGRDMAVEVIIARYKKYGIRFRPEEIGKLEAILEDCRKKAKEIKDKAYSGFDPTIEAEHRFFIEVFGIDLTDLLDKVVDFEDLKRRMPKLREQIKTKRIVGR